VTCDTDVDIALFQQAVATPPPTSSTASVPLLRRDRTAFPRDLGLAVVTNAALPGTSSSASSDASGFAFRSASPNDSQAALATGLTYVMGCDRRVEEWVSCEGTLKGPTPCSGRSHSVYWIVPVTLNRYCDADVGAGTRAVTRQSEGEFAVITLSSALRVRVELV
jgi:hypothetical protein